MDTKTMTSEQFAAWMKRRNKQFAKLTKAQKRVRIAKDVLDQIAAKRLRPAHMGYVTLNETCRVDLEADGSKQIAELLCTQGKCTVCAVGGLFVCAVERADNLTVGQRVGSEDSFRFGERPRLDEVMGSGKGYLLRFFSGSQLTAIEQWFEAWKNDMPRAWEDMDATRRMTRIMKNIVANKGTFKPAQLRAELQP